MSCPASQALTMPVYDPIVELSGPQPPVNQSAMGADPSNEYNDSASGTSSIYPPENQPLSGGGFSAGEFSPPEALSEIPVSPTTDPTLGSLSKKYESNGDPTVIGRDSTGGYSYGEYQIATKTGTFSEYMDYLEINDPTTYDALGGESAKADALAGTPAFKATWKSVMSNPSSAQTQHDFIQATHYDPAVSKVASTSGVDINSRDKAVQDALWSTAVQHGPSGANKIVARAIKRSGKTAETISDRELITAIYDERGDSNGTKYFGSSTSRVRASVVKRFSREKQDALSLLG